MPRRKTAKTPKTKKTPRYPNNVAAIRRSRGMTQKELGSRSDFDYRTIGKIERGDTRLNQVHLERLSRALEVERDALLPTEGRRMVAVAGYVGAGGDVIPIDDHARGAGMDEVNCPPGFDPESVVAVVVKGRSKDSHRAAGFPSEIPNDGAVETLS